MFLCYGRPSSLTTDPCRFPSAKPDLSMAPRAHTDALQILAALRIGTKIPEFKAKMIDRLTLFWLEMTAEDMTEEELKTITRDLAGG